MYIIPIILVISYIIYLIYVSFIYSNVDTGSYGKYIFVWFGILLLLISLIFNYYKWNKNKIVGIWLLLSVMIIFSVQTYSIMQCKSCTGSYTDTTNKDQSYITAVKNTQRYIFYKSMVAMILFSIVGISIYLLQTNLCNDYIFISITASYAIFTLIENISYLKPEWGFIKDPKVLINEKFQDTSLLHIIIISMLVFGSLIILNDFHQTKLYKNIKSPGLVTPQFGGGNKIINNSIYVTLFIILYFYSSTRYQQNNCGSWNYENISTINNIRKINTNIIINILVLFSIFLSFGSC